MNRINFQKLEDLCLKITDGSHYSPAGVEFGIPMLSVKDMNYSGFSYSSSKYVSEKDYFDLVRADCKPLLNDILIAKDGSYLKHVFVIKKEINQAILSSIGILRPNLKKINPDYLKYYLQTTSVKNTVSRKYVSGSALPRIILKNFGKISVIYRNILDQQKIAITLSTLDAKIELNNKINSELEKMVKTIYDYWFVQFDFPDENGKPYKSSGGKMVWSEELKREIPKEWTATSLYKNSLTSILKPKIDIFEGSKEYLATANINNREIIKGDLITYENRESRANMQPVANSAWFAKMKASKKHIFVGKYSKDIIENNIFSTGFLGLKCEDFAFEYITSFISSDIFELTKDIISHGATMQGIGNDDLKFIKLIVPNKEVLMGYKKITEGIYKKIDLIRRENRGLEEMRDWLLPMLMNGQVTIM